ncbi:MAG: bifunctional hydroxymethylpyrimidine kinase/phosphomethylpyrimidine kinase [Deltaproteobacteria bacterium]|nr:bifunctional hydroxymethylpyrimidine kinase/phosphomethylpyrimidine kinase [Deltaproteobacteria bacterium]
MPCLEKRDRNTILDSTLGNGNESPLVSQKEDKKKTIKGERPQNYLHHPISTIGRRQNKGQPKALTIAGSDSGGGAGIQADLKTFSSLGVWGLSVVTALTAQNTLGVQQVFNVPQKCIEQQLASIFNDMGTNAVKTGMLWSPNTVEAVTECLEAKNILLVVDPVLAAKRGEALLLPKAIPILKKRLFPLATLVTPNIPETELLTGISPITTKDMVQQAAKKITDMGASNVLIKGGHFPGQIFDLFFDGKEYIFFEKKRFSSPHLHGVGCTLAAAITAYLALGLTLLEAVQQAQKFITKAIQHSMPLGKGIGPVNPNLGNLEPKI